MMLKKISFLIGWISSIALSVVIIAFWIYSNSATVVEDPVAQEAIRLMVLYVFLPLTILTCPLTYKMLAPLWRMVFGRKSDPSAVQTEAIGTILRDPITPKVPGILFKRSSTKKSAIMALALTLGFIIFLSSAYMIGTGDLFVLKPQFWGICLLFGGILYFGSNRKMSDWTAVQDIMAIELTHDAIKITLKDKQPISWPIDKAAFEIIERQVSNQAGLKATNFFICILCSGSTKDYDESLLSPLVFSTREQAKDYCQGLNDQLDNRLKVISP